MVEKLPRSPSQQGNAGKEISISLPDETPCCTRKWYFSRQEIEDHSPSRKDGIDLKKESRLRKLYCSFLQELGMTLKVPQVTIATAIMLCHQFYMRQSHAKNDWQTIATVSMFLGCKLEDTTRLRKDVVTAAYEILHKRDPSAPGRIRQKELFNKQQELLLIGEKFLLATIAYDLDIQLPYKPLVAALKRLKLGNDIPQVAWNFVNDWLCTTLCLQYKPHYIAAGSVFLAAKYQKVKLPTKKGNVWWLEFDISPKLLEEVIKHMLRLLEQDKGQTPVPVRGRSEQPTAATGKPIHGEPKSSVKKPIDGQHSNNGALLETGKLATSNTNSCQNSSHGEKIATPEEVLLSRTSESGNASSVIEDGDGENPPAVADSNQNSRCKIVSVENGSGDCDQNPSCKIASLENGAGDSGQNLRCSTVSGHNAESVVVEDCDDKKLPEARDSDQNTSGEVASVHNSAGGSNSNSKHMFDAARIRETVKKRISEKAVSGHNAESVVGEDGDDKKLLEARDSDQNTSGVVACVHNSAGGSNNNSNSKQMIDAARIREMVKKRRLEKAVSGHNAESVVREDGDDKKLLEARDFDQNTSGEVSSVHNSAGGSNNNSNSKQMIDAARIREMVKKRRLEKAVCGHNAESVVVEDGDHKKLSEAKDSDQNISGEVASVHNSAGGSNNHSNSKHMIDAARIREALKKRRLEKAANNKTAEVKNDDMDIETWIERKLENEIELESGPSDKKRRIGL